MMMLVMLLGVVFETIIQFGFWMMPACGGLK